MDTTSGFSVERHDSFKEGYFNGGRQFRGICIANVNTTCKDELTTNDVPEAYKPFGIFKDTKGNDPNIDVIASGVPIVFGQNNESWGIVMNDTRNGEDAILLVETPRDQPTYLLVDPTATGIKQGDQMYMIPPTTATTGGQLTNVAGGNILLPGATFLNEFSDVLTNPAGLPLGAYIGVIVR